MAVGPFSTFTPPGLYGAPCEVTWPDGTMAPDAIHEFESEVGLARYRCSGCGMTAYQGTTSKSLSEILKSFGVPDRCSETVVLAVMES